jgi:hypothetical protein
VAVNRLNREALSGGVNWTTGASFSTTLWFNSFSEQEDGQLSLVFAKRKKRKEGRKKKKKKKRNKNR